MEHCSAREKVRAIAARYVSSGEIRDDVPLSSRPYFLDYRSLAAVFLEVEQEFGVDLDMVFDQPLDYSVNSIADAAASQP
ncbi:MAG: hypothetical protein FWE20_12185 [Defluviitaleaceae bacterium]|nr:hypothetical protein [Defluviitaleaceae bacterium]